MYAHLLDGDAMTARKKEGLVQQGQWRPLGIRKAIGHQMFGTDVFGPYLNKFATIQYLHQRGMTCL